MSIQEETHCVYTGRKCEIQYASVAYNKDRQWSIPDEEARRVRNQKSFPVSSAVLSNVNLLSGCYS